MPVEQRRAFERVYSIVGSAFVVFSWFRLNYFQIDLGTLDSVIRLVPTGGQTALVIIGCLVAAGGVLIEKSPRWGAVIALGGIGLFTAEAFAPYEVAGEPVGIGAQITPIWFIGVAILVGMLFIGAAESEDEE